MSLFKGKIPIWVWFAGANLGLIAAAGIVWYFFFSGGGGSSPNRVPNLPARPVAGTPASSASSPTNTPNSFASGSAPTTPIPPADHPKLSVAEIVKQVDRGVVLITVSNAKKEKLGLGSGFLIDKSGLVATNFHVIRKSASATATFADGTVIPIDGCRAWDTDRDMAILQLSKVPETAQPLALCKNTDRFSGSEVIAIGHPEGFRFTTTTGIISAVHMTQDLPGSYAESINAPPDNVWIQTSAAINHGNSGGPLLNFDGEVIGINTWGATEGQNLGFANDIRYLIDLQTSKLAAKTLSLNDLTAPEQEVDDLVADYARQYAYVLTTASKSWTPSAAKKMLEEKHPAGTFLPKAMAMADKYRGIPAGFRAIEAACLIASRPDCPAKMNDLFKPIAARVLSDYLERPGIVRDFLRMDESPLDESREMLRQAAEKSKTPKTRAFALLSLALLLEHRASLKKEHSDEAITLLQQILDKYGKLRWQERDLSELIDPLIFSLKNLQVGRTAPEIVGKDLEGAEFKLSDFRGKIVVLEFWADLTAASRQLYPQDRQIAKTYKDKPVVVVGVNCDDSNRLQQIVENHTVTWRNWANGPRGPLIHDWQIRQLPVIFVLDQEGVIRYKDVRGPLLDQALAELVKKIDKPGNVAAKPAVKPAVKTEDSDKDAMRSWTRRDGRSAKMRFVKLDGDKASFETASGKTYILALADLSDDDQDWIRKHAK